MHDLAQLLAQHTDMNNAMCFILTNSFDLTVLQQQAVEGLAELAIIAFPSCSVPMLIALDLYISRP